MAAADVMPALPHDVIQHIITSSLADQDSLFTMVNMAHASHEFQDIVKGTLLQSKKVCLEQTINRVMNALCFNHMVECSSLMRGVCSSLSHMQYLWIRHQMPESLPTFEGFFPVMKAASGSGEAKEELYFGYEPDLASGGFAPRCTLRIPLSRDTSSLMTQVSDHLESCKDWLRFPLQANSLATMGPMVDPFESRNHTNQCVQLYFSKSKPGASILTLPDGGVSLDLYLAPSCVTEVILARLVNKAGSQMKQGSVKFDIHSGTSENIGDYTIDDLLKKMWRGGWDSDVPSLDYLATVNPWTSCNEAVRRLVIQVSDPYLARKEWIKKLHAAVAFLNSLSI